MTQSRSRPEIKPSEAADETRRLRQRIRKRFREHEELALWMRALLFLVGWLLVLVGLAGLVLPGLQGVLTLVAGAAVLSLVSEIAYKVLRWCFRRWPRGWRRVSKWRRKLRLKLMRYGSRRRTGADARPPSEDPGSEDREE